MLAAGNVSEYSIKKEGLKPVKESQLLIRGRKDDLTFGPTSGLIVSVGPLLDFRKSNAIAAPAKVSINRIAAPENEVN
ncbi:hypothetical protein CEXT_616181 [Caerostris extrusa]|uniref:Uncharacterized protein n=1 Tax=Caerostris extrusa TaxID=172846 RepID=A0AAV4NT33_CAEEX|nr:hypothetical protein CEXT_616181 [Caerostris extrusa]